MSDTPKKKIYIHIFHIIESHEIFKVKLYPYWSNELEDKDFKEITESLEKQFIEDDDSDSNYLDYYGAIEEDAEAYEILLDGKGKYLLPYK
jgi:hypothetical protein